MRKLIGGAAMAGVAIFAGVGAMGDETTRSDSGEIVEAGGLGVFVLQVGDCVQLPSELDLVESVEGVPCTTPHDAQIYVEFDLIGTEYPGQDATGDFAVNGCYDRFEEATGATFESALDWNLTTFFPIDESWKTGDRTVTCMIIRLDLTKWTGSELAVDRL